MTSPFVQQGPVSGSAAASSLTPAMPSGRTTGNLLVAFIGMPRAGRTFSYSSGWTEFDHLSGSDHSGSLAYRYVDGTETDPTITISGLADQAAARVFEFTGTTASSPIGATHHTETFSFGGAVTDAGITSTADNSFAVVFCEGSSGTVTLSTPSGYALEGSVNGSSGGTIGSWDQTLGASGSASTSVSITPSSGGAYGVYSVELLAATALTLTLTGVASGNAFGAPTLAPGAVSLSLTGFADGDAFGSPTLSTGPFTLALSGFANANAFGTPDLEPGTVPFPPADAGKFYLAWILETLADQDGINLACENIDDQVFGFFIASDKSLAQVLTDHKGAFNYQIVDGDPIRVVRREVNDDLSIDFEIAQADCKNRGNGQPVIQLKRVDPATLPREVELQYVDPDRAYATNTQVARHFAAPRTNAKVTVAIDFVISGDQARALAYDLLYRIWSQQLSLAFEVDDLRIEPGDTVRVTCDQGVFTCLVQENNYDSKNKTNQVQATVLLTSKGVTVASGSADPYVVPNTDIDTGGWMTVL